MGSYMSDRLDRRPETERLAELGAYLSQRVGHERPSGALIEKLRLLHNKHEIRLSDRVRPQTSVRTSNENVMSALILNLGAAEDDHDRRVEGVSAVSLA